MRSFLKCVHARWAKPAAFLASHQRRSRSSMCTSKSRLGSTQAYSNSWTIDMPPLYGEDLAYIHHVGFGDFAASAAPGILRLLRRSGITSGLIVDLGCGSGILAEALLSAGYEVLGVDASPAMIRLARRQAPRGRFVTESLRTFRLPVCNAITAI